MRTITFGEAPAFIKNQIHPGQIEPRAKFACTDKVEFRGQAPKFSKEDPMTHFKGRLNLLA